MENKPKVVIADSSGLLALLLESDTNHSLALRLQHVVSDQIGTIIIPSEVLVETVNMITKRFGQQLASKLALELSSLPGSTISESSQSLREAAMKKLQNPVASLSLTDGIVMATADSFHTSTIFGFEEGFRLHGYTHPGE